MPRGFVDLLMSGGPVFVAADAVAKATILLCLATAIAWALHRRAAAVRHRLWSLALCGLILLPLLSWWLPGWRLPILRGGRFGWNACFGEREGFANGRPSGCHRRRIGEVPFDTT